MDVFRWMLWASLLATPGFAQAPDQRWSFRVFLDEKPIGSHVFTLRDLGAVRELKSQANFAVKFLMLTAYRYEHTAIEQWRGGCLVSMNASTDDDGTKLAVSTQQEGSNLMVVANGIRTPLSGCVKSFAYWNPEILGADRLLNAQTGQWEAVIIEAQGRDTFPNAQGQRVSAKRYRIVGPKQPIVLWYDDANRWIGLESNVGKGRKLTYRLQ
ncbi:MAG: DUF6134 family protein [Holophaga sp.]